MHYIELKVEGRGNFPLDMLRRAQLFPLDAVAVEGIDKPARYNSPREVRLGMYGHITAAYQAIERFDSFGWKAEVTHEERGLK